MKNLEWLIPSLLLLVLLSGCGKKASPYQGYNNGFSVVEKSNRIESDIISPSNVLERSTKNISSNERNSVLYKHKLRKCGIKYEPWKDRLEKDLILMPKLINICSNVKGTAKKYTFHASKKKRSKGFTLKKHLFIPYNWNSKQIKKYLNNVSYRKMTNYYKIGNSKSRVIKTKVHNSNVVKTYSNNVLDIGTPFTYIQK